MVGAFRAAVGNREKHARGDLVDAKEGVNHLSKVCAELWAAVQQEG